MRMPKKLYLCRYGDMIILLDDVIRRCKIMGTGNECSDCRGEVIFEAVGDRKPKPKKKIKAKR